LAVNPERDVALVLVPIGFVSILIGIALLVSPRRPIFSDAIECARPRSPLKLTLGNKARAFSSESLPGLDPGGYRFA